MQIFSESNKDTIMELSRYASGGLIGLAIGSGAFYFVGVCVRIPFNNISVYSMLQYFIVSASGERLTTRLRVQLFRAFLHQTIGWYDDEEHTTGALTTILSLYADKVKNVSCHYFQGFHKVGPRTRMDILRFSGIALKAKPVLDAVENHSPWPTFSRKSEAGPSFLALTVPL